VLRTRLRSAQATVPLFYRRDVNARAVPIATEQDLKICFALFQQRKHQQNVHKTSHWAAANAWGHVRISL
jgi:hypothetical protein